MTAHAAFLDALAREVRGEVRSDAWNRVFYSTDASIYRRMPIAVLIPETIDDVQAAVTLAAEHRVPILPRGSGSSLAGQAVNEALVIDFTRHLDRVLEFDADAGTVRVEPGVVLGALNARLASDGWTFGPDPASADRATVGGVVANNSTGAHSILYGMTADHVRSMRVVLADGSLADLAPATPDVVRAKAAGTGLEAAIYRGIDDLVRTDADAIVAGTPKHWRRAGGYNLDRFVDGPTFRAPRTKTFDLAQLVCGSEGTLAVIRDVTLSLVRRPAAAGLALVQFDTLRAALEAVPVLLEAAPTAIELLDRMAIVACRAIPAYGRRLARVIDGDPDCVLITEFTGESDAAVVDVLARFERHVAADAVPAHVVSLPDAARQDDVWEVRKAGLGLLMSQRGDLKPIPFIEDAAVPVEHLADYVTQIESFCNDLGTRVAYYAHASAGCLHVRPIIDQKCATDVAKLERIARFSVDLVGGYGGAIASEHGDGRARSAMNEHFFGPALYGAYRKTKAIFDPDGLLNPGIVVDAGSIDADLRFGADYRTTPPETHVDFASDHGFDRAIEMCNGAGVCRKATGTMCPSFMVTREEEHSTRGRANALRAAISGVLPADALTDPRMHDVMALCVECKACKAECPSSVDMAKLKVEFLAHYHARHGVPWRTRAMAALPTLARWGAGWRAPLANAVGRFGPARFALERGLGIARERPLPTLARRPFTRRGAAHARADRRVVLLVDTFARFFEPSVAHAAVDVLEAAGFAVIPHARGCCGRTALSGGRVDRARTLARETVASLVPYARDGVPIVGLEPSCVLTLVDEYPWLLPGDDDAAAVAAKSTMIESFLAAEHDAGRFATADTARADAVVLHPHCHQRAIVGAGDAKRLLGAFADTVRDPDGGCCGMAGAFGFSREHYATSIAMAERRLLPFVRDTAPDVPLLAAGISCRQQIRHGTARTVRHPIEWLRDRLTAER